ncbi:hypothetical protein ENE74_10935 [Sphingobium algorifonticola]|uniref:Uncharacterized protein n=1 Tax=Sphingobium algorifonticola TaxID=2008318 RepID=A0A437J7G7_9SPHN|nr:hypothetical protein ENE74_10935 [Sphingobium algorifonticola]
MRGGQSFWISPSPFGLSLSKPPTERSEVSSLRSGTPFDKLRANGIAVFFCITSPLPAHRRQ